MTVVARYPVSLYMTRKHRGKVCRAAYVKLPNHSGVLTRVLMTLEHQLGVAGSGVPELYSSILGAA